MLTAERLRQLFSYDPETGLFTRRVSRGRTKVGSIAGADRGDGRKQLGIDWHQYLTSRLAWLYMMGSWPPKGHEVDHRDLNRSNDSWSNLRLATRSQNEVNKGLRRDNKSGFKGVYFDRKLSKFVAEVSINGRRVYLGCFNSAELAHQAHCTAAHVHYGEFARTR